MGAEVAKPASGLEAEEARLARAAARGDGEAFATLYERYARRAYNLALRLSGSEHDAADAVQEAFVNVMRRLGELGERDLAFGSYLFTATRNATYDLMRSARRAQPSESIADSAVPVGAGAGGLGLDPGDPGDDPDRRAMLASQQEEIRAANARLPERQREALALRELEELSYDEIAAVMDMNRNSVAQLISRARIGLRDELRGTALASVAASSPQCERALPLIALRDDGQLEAGSADAAWLDSHLAECDTCPLAAAAMQEAGASYRLWVPAAIAPLLLRETMARAAEAVGADWSEVADRRLRAPTDPRAIPGLPVAYRPLRAASGRRRRALTAAAVAALLLLGGGTAAVLAGGGEEVVPKPASAEETTVEASEPSEPAPEPAEGKKRKPGKEKREPQAPATPAAEAEPGEAAPVPAPVAAPAPEPAKGGGEKQSSPPQAMPAEGGIDSTDPVTKPAPEPEPEPEPAPEPPATTPPPEPPPAPEPEEPNPTRPPRPPTVGSPAG